jgi:nitroreductase
MANVLETIQKRRSIRKFQDKPVPTDLIEKMMEAVQWSPSWGNTQCWEVVAVTDPTIKEKLKDTLMTRNPAIPAIINAPLVLAVCARMKASGFYKDTATTKFGDWFMFDLGLATQSICLVAQDLGLSTVIVGSLDHDQANTVLKSPEGCTVLVLIPVGYPDQDPSPPKRREISEFFHRNTF